MLNADGCEVGITNMCSLTQQQCPITVSWTWIQPEEFARRSICERVKFYWKGLWHNRELKAVMLRLRSKITVLSTRVKELVDEAQRDERGMAERNEKEYTRRAVTFE